MSDLSPLVEFVEAGAVIAGIIAMRVGFALNDRREKQLKQAKKQTSEADASSKVLVNPSVVCASSMLHVPLLGRKSRGPEGPRQG